MATEIRFKRGTSDKVGSYTSTKVGEPVYDYDTGRLYVVDKNEELVPVDHDYPSDKNALERAQGVHMTAAASGSRGIQVADNANINFGTGDFTLVWKGSLPDWTPSVATILAIKKQTSLIYFGMYVNTNGKLVYYQRVNGETGISISTVNAPTLSDNTAHVISAIINRETVSVDGLVSFYVDNAFFESVAIPASAHGSIDNTGAFYFSGNESVRYASTTQAAYLYNRALSAEEVKNLYKYGIAEEDKWGSVDRNWMEVAPRLGTEPQIFSLAVFNNKLYGGTIPNGKLFEWNGTNAWVEVAPQAGGTETYILSLAVFNNKLYGGTVPNGKLFEWNGTNAWVEVAPQAGGTETQIYSLAVFNNKLYGGTLPNGKLFEWNGTNAWVEVAP
jgi:hypothetical protein